MNTRQLLSEVLSEVLDGLRHSLRRHLLLEGDKHVEGNATGMMIPGCQDPKERPIETELQSGMGMMTAALCSSPPWTRAGNNIPSITHFQ